MDFQASTQDSIYKVSTVGGQWVGGRTCKERKEARGRTECGVRWGWRGGQRKAQAGPSRLEFTVYPTVGKS